MILIALLLSIFAFTRTIGYAIYEYKKNSNKLGSVIISVLAVTALIGSIIVTMIWFYFLR